LRNVSIGLTELTKWGWTYQLPTTAYFLKYGNLPPGAATRLFSGDIHTIDNQMPAKIAVTLSKRFNNSLTIF
jgi:hypothetical protein